MTVRAAIIDDSPSIQSLLTAVLQQDSEIEVVGVAADPFEARDLIKRENPDVITLDVEMPRMSGIDFLRKVMALRPMPVVMISSHTGKGTEMSLEALAEGAFCCLPKPRIDNEAALVEVCQMVKQAARSSDAVRRNAKANSGISKNVKVLRRENEPDLIALGSSTGGVEALTALFSTFPADCPPTVVAQHMPSSFTKSFAARLDRVCAPKVIEAENRRSLERGHIYIAPGSIGHTIVTKTDVLRTRIHGDQPVGGHMPAVDVLFESVSTLTDLEVSAALLTGMGADGAEGMLKLRKSGAKTIAQDEETSLVYGMPLAAKKLGAAQQILPIDEIAAALFDVAIGKGG